MDRKLLYQQFQEAFPLESLSELTLDQYTNLNKEDSFCYWLESKTYELGSIWGGSSYKFGIFKFDKIPKQDNPNYSHDDRFSWNSKLGATSAEAFETVKSAIIRIAQNARKANWTEIEKITELWPVIIWKIAFLYSNEKLLPIYDKDGWLVPLAKHFGLATAKQASRTELYNYLLEKKGDKDLYVFYEELLQIMAAKTQQHEQKVWLFAPGENACMWEECKSLHNMRLGWDPIEDIMEFKNRSELTNQLQIVYGKNASFKNDSLALWQFAHEINVGDIVYAKKGINKIIGRGIVDGEYYYDENLPTYRHVRSVNWTHLGEWDYPPHKFPLKTLTNISKYPDFVKNLNEIIVTNDTIVTPDTSTNHRYWWLVANPKMWSIGDMPVGSIQAYTLYNDNGNCRRIFQNFLDAKEGDVVIGYESTPTKQVVAIAEIAKANDGKYIYFRKKESLPTPIDYSVIKAIPRLAGMEYMKNQQGSFFKLKEEEYNMLMELIREENPIKNVQIKEIYGAADFLADVFMNEKDYTRLKSLLLTKKNVILQGAPGVGKTFSAKRLAYSIMGEIDKTRVEFVQFHQSYTYEDFIMGYKPNEEGGFKLKTGVFYNFCKKAKADPDNQYFFIIDEINRGNLSKIFGELLMLIEKDYRGEQIKLAYRDEMFDVPNNLYIIGMMNTADRSLAMIDYALRRRFSFFEMTPGFSSKGFKAYQSKIANEKFDKVIEGIQALNEVICKDDSLGRGFCIGHSYFYNLEEFSQEWLENVINFDIEPMLKEYWFDDSQKFENQINIIRSLLK